MSAIKVSFLFFFLLQCCYAPTLKAEGIKELYEAAVDANQRQDFDRAIELYQAIIKMAPRFAPAYLGMGLALKSKGGDMDEVLYYYKTATDIDPDNAEAFEQTGRLYYSINKFGKAEKSFLRALHINPQMPSVKLSLGWVYLMGLSKPELAIKYFKESLKTEESPNALFGLGMAYFSSNERVQAMDVITKLRNMNQDEFANRLEQMVRENRRVALESQEEDPSDAVVDADPIPTTKPAASGVKVRLKGHLSDI